MYVRPTSGMITPAIKNLILANVAVFLVQHLWSYLNIEDLFGLKPAYVIAKFYIWQVVTYMFLHSPSGLGHIFFNMFALWMFGVELERTWGTKEFIKYYFLTGVLAGVSILFWNLLSGGNPFALTIGASGAVFGILAAYALFYPDNEILLWFLVPVKAKYFVLFYGLLELWSLPSQDGVSHIAHLGGMVAGYFYIRHKYKHWGIGQKFFRNFFKKKDRW